MLLLVAPGLARGYTISSAVGPGCHEAITSEALRRVRSELATAAPIPADKNEQALIDDVDYHPGPDMLDLGATSLLLAVRDNDVKGHSSTDLSQLALVHGDPRAQEEHCLRAEDDKEPAGSQQALARCRAFILTRAGEAIAGLDADSVPDANHRTVLPIYLQLRHRVDASLPTYYVRIGQALHALEDSFAHTYRTADGKQVTVVLNWVNQINGNWVESRDGPPHAADLDRCDDPDPLRAERHALAIDAATDLLRATLDPSLDPTQKLASVGAVLDTYLASSPGCTFENGWCDAPERRYRIRYRLGCSIGGMGVSRSAQGTAPLVLLMLLVPAACARRRPRLVWCALLATICLLSARLARAQPETSGQAAPVSAAPSSDASPVKPVAMAPGAAFDGAVSSDHAAFALALGFRLRAHRHFTAGIDVEWNPFLTYNGVSVRAGVLNAYATAIVRLPLARERLDLRSTLHVGMSRMLIALYGVPRGSTGLFLGFAPLGLEWRLSQRTCLVINPLGVALPAPRLSGVPYTYLQYRVTVGIEAYTR
ncbi:MAG: hypothetical protein JXP73_17715 [Deltaproteobacteria bacterium]|nr:hypothetical protein [Deltaproteobacteria bacterium]